MRINEVMVTDVTVVAAETTIDVAAQIMADLDFGAPPIGRPAVRPEGILTGRDILLRVIAPRCDPRTTRVDDAAVIVMAPIAASLAATLRLHADPFLMAVAVGAGSDFLTPIGHQCNTLVMGPGGYRFGDYWHFGLPLSCLVVLVGAPLIALIWPLH
jgi:hypothetical protein